MRTFRLLVTIHLTFTILLLVLAPAPTSVKTLDPLEDLTTISIETAIHTHRTDSSGISGTMLMMPGTLPVPSITEQQVQPIRLL